MLTCTTLFGSFRSPRGEVLAGCLLAWEVYLELILLYGLHPSSFLFNRFAVVLAWILCINRTVLENTGPCFTSKLHTHFWPLLGVKTCAQHHRHNTIDTTPSAQHHRHNTIGTTPSAQHHRHNTIDTTPSTQHHRHNTIDTTPSTQHHRHNTIDTTSAFDITTV